MLVHIMIGRDLLKAQQKSYDIIKYAYSQHSIRTLAVPALRRDACAYLIGRDLLKAQQNS